MELEDTLSNTNKTDILKIEFFTFLILKTCGNSFSFLQFWYVPFQTELVMAQSVSETENVDAVDTVESEVCDELQSEENENINIDIAQRIPSSETDVDKLKKIFREKNG